MAAITQGFSDAGQAKVVALLLANATIKHVGWGSGTTAFAVTQTGLVSANPEARTSGVISNPSVNIHRVVATVEATAARTAPKGPTDIVLRTSAVVEAPSETPTRGGGGKPIILPKPPLALIQRVRVRYDPARITAKDTVPIRYAARLGPAHVNTRAAATTRYHPETAQVTILHREPIHLTVRASLPDDLEVLILAAAAWE